MNWEEGGKEGFGVLLCGFLSALNTALYFNSQDLIGSTIWALPIGVSFTIIGIMLLGEYQKKRKMSYD